MPSSMVVRPVGVVTEAEPPPSMYSSAPAPMTAIDESLDEFNGRAESFFSRTVPSWPATVATLSPWLRVADEIGPAAGGGLS